MTKNEVKARIQAIGIIPAVRVSSEEDALFAVGAVLCGGIPIVELTMTTPGAAEIISTLVKSHPDLIVGAGTVLDVETARRCIGCGAEFITSTGLDRETVDFVLDQKVVVIPGALTPTEVMAAWKAGADFVKVYPCSQVGGPAYIRALNAPFPHVPLIASGGVSQSNAVDFIAAGAVALGVGGNLIPREAVHERSKDWICELARRFVEMVREAKSQRIAK
jgi:2-dehydro-3-deoxyphosphogluconate aldolase/(4S)-4-hydroxy-2-oxoglutarate aldolase